MERSTREALLAESIGDLGKLLDRVDTLTPAIDNACKKMTAAAHDLAASVKPFTVHIGGIAAETEKTTVERIVSRANAASAKLVEMQTQAMLDLSKAIVDREVGPPLHRLASNLAQLVQQQRRSWETWATHAATAAVAAILAATLVLNVVYRSSSPALTTGATPASSAASDSGVDPVRQEQRTPEGDAAHSAAASSTRRLKGR
jgi:hypothetical protein